MRNFGFTAAGMVFATLCSNAALALQVSGTADLDMRYTDNAAQVATNEDSDLITTARIAGSVQEDQGVLTGHANAAFRYLDYMEGTFSSQDYFDLDSMLHWQQIRNLLEWTVNDQFGQVAVNSLAPGVPSNLENINAFNLNATLTLRPGDRHTVTVTPAYRDFYYETSNADNHQTGIAASWLYQLSQSMAVSLNGGTRKVKYDDATLNADYTGSNVGVGMNLIRNRTEISANIGSRSVNRDFGSDTNGLVASLAAVYRLTGRSSVSANLSRDISDTSDAFLASALDPNLGNYGTIQTSADVVRNELARIAFTRAGNTLNFNSWFELRRLNYQNLLSDRKSQELGASLGYAYSPRLSAVVRGQFIRSDETDLALIDRYYLADGSVSYALSRKLNARAGLQLQHRTNTDSARDFDEFSMFAGIGYKLGR